MATDTLNKSAPSPVPESSVSAAAPLDKSLLQLSENFNFAATLKPGIYIDARDTVSIWCLAKIKDCVKDSVLFRYDGWTDKHNETKKIWAGSIAPVRSKTRGYTGSKTATFRDYKYSLAEVKECTDLLQSLIDSNMTAMKDPFELTQFIRAKLFVLLDSVLSLYLNSNEAKALASPQKPSLETVQQEIQANMRLCSTVIKLICWYLGNFRELQSFYMETTAYSNLVYVSLKHAVAGIFPELVEMLKILFALSINKGESFTTRSEATRREMLNFKCDYVKVNFAEFCKQKGLELLANLLSGDQHSPVPFTFCLEWLNVLTPAMQLDQDAKATPASKSDSAGTPSLKALSAQLLQELNLRAKSLSENDMKSLELSSVESCKNIFSNLAALAGHTSLKDEKSTSHYSILRIASQLLNCSILKKKLLGMNIICQMIPKHQQGQGFGEKTKGGILEWSDYKSFTQGIFSEKILETVLHEGSHPELVKKSQEIFFYLLSDSFRSSSSSSGSFSMDFKYISCIWQCAKGKFEQVSQAAYELLVNIAPRLPKKHAKTLFKSICEVPIEAYNEVMLGFLQNYFLQVMKGIDAIDGTGGLMKAHLFIAEPPQIPCLAAVMGTPNRGGRGQPGKKQGAGQAEESTSEKLFSLDLLWSAAHSEKLPMKIRDQAIGILAGIIIFFLSIYCPR